jgi:hypothetical protein
MDIIKKEVARSYIESHGSKWLITIENFWTIPGKEEDLVYCVYKSTPQGGWADTKKFPNCVSWAGTMFLDGFVQGRNINKTPLFTAAGSVPQGAGENQHPLSKKP